MSTIDGLGYLGAVPGKSAGFKGVATATNLLQVSGSPRTHAPYSEIQHQPFSSSQRCALRGCQPFGVAIPRQRPIDPRLRWHDGREGEGGWRAVSRTASQNTLLCLMHQITLQLIAASLLDWRSGTCCWLRQLLTCEPHTRNPLPLKAKLQKIQSKTISRLVQKAHGSKLEPGSVAYNKVAEKVACTFLDHTAGDAVTAKFNFATLELLEKVKELAHPEEELGASECHQ